MLKSVQNKLYFHSLQTIRWGEVNIDHMMYIVHLFANVTQDCYFIPPVCLSLKLGKDAQ